MTFEEMDGRLLRRLQLDQNTRLGDDPFTRQDIILRAVDKIAEETWCNYGERTTGLVASQSSYCLPAVFFRIDNVLAKDASGNWRTLTQYDSETEADALLGSYWRSDQATADPPSDCIWNNVGSVTLYRPPSTARTAALKFEGYYAPGDAWEYSAGVALPFARSQTCPLPEFTHEAALSRAIYEAACMDDRPYILNQLPMLRAEADDAAGSVEGKVMVYHQRNSQRTRNPFAFRR